MDWLKRNPLLGVLAAICVLLAIVIGLEAKFGATLRDAMRPASARPAMPTDAKLLPPLVATVAEQAYPETTARPLFTPTRRPAPELAAAPVSTFQKGQFVLAGVIVVGDNRVAMLREKSNGRIHRVERGKEVNGIKVAEIQTEQVTLAQGGEQEVLTLIVQKAAAGSSSAIVQGPFGAVPAAPGMPAPQGVLPSGQIGSGIPVPAAPPPPPPGPGPMGIIPGGGASPNPAARAAPDAPSTALSPEELLARRRARRTQPNQTQ